MIVPCPPFGRCGLQRVLRSTSWPTGPALAQSNIAAYESARRVPSATMLARLRDAARPRPSDVLDAHRAEILAIARQHKATAVRVFGSTARGEDRSGSDLDLLGRMATDADVFDLAEMIARLEEPTGLHDQPLAERYGPRVVRALEDLVSFADTAARLVALGREQYDTDEVLRLASEEVVHKIGEAVARLPDDFIDDHRDVPWRAMKATRNIGAHQYDYVNYDILWNALAHRLPREAEVIRRLLGQTQSGQT